MFLNSVLRMFSSNFLCPVFWPTFAIHKDCSNILFDPTLDTSTASFQSPTRRRLALVTLLQMHKTEQWDCKNGKEL